MLKYVLLLALLPGFAHAAVDVYRVEFVVGFDVPERKAQVKMRLAEDPDRPSRFNFRMPAQRYAQIDGNGRIEREGERLVWYPPERGVAELRYRYTVDHERSDGAFDARQTDSFAIFRGDDVFPPVKVRGPRGARSNSYLMFDLPAGWTADSGYPGRPDGWFEIDDPRRAFDRPVGWMIAGDLGTRREFIDGLELSIAAPKGDTMRRQDVLALISYNLPEMDAAFGRLPRKLLIVGSGDPFWRGGLSAPNSLFLHSERPLISENATSTLLHELVHVITRIRGEPGHDWIAEGLAEYYGIELLHRSGGTSPARHAKTYEWLERWSRKIDSLRTRKSRGPRTARAVLLIRAIDEEIRAATKDERSIDDVTRGLMKLRRRVTTEDFREIAERIAGGPLDSLKSPLLKDPK